MKLSPIIVAAALAGSAPTLAEPTAGDPSSEQTFVACLADKDPALIEAIRDADSQEALGPHKKEVAEAAE